MLMQDDYPQKNQVTNAYNEVYWSTMEFFYDFKRMKDFKLNYGSLNFSNYINLLEWDLKKQPKEF